MIDTNTADQLTHTKDCTSRVAFANGLSAHITLEPVGSKDAVRSTFRV